MTRKISEDTVRHVAKLARLELTPAEARKFEKDMNDIISAFRVLDEAPTAEPSFQPIPMENVLREDKPDACMTNEKALGNTKHKEKGFFKGPKAV